MENNMNDNNRFEEIANAYGHVEATLGQNAYQSLVDASLSRSEVNKAVAAFIRISALSILLMTIPVIVWLWKWAI
jgi:hypothetical protein